jgi:hypothetical protein
MDAAILMALREAAIALGLALEYRDVLVKSEVPCTDQAMRLATWQSIHEAKRLLFASEELLRVSGLGLGAES